jgi:hypothetical protein
MSHHSRLEKVVIDVPAGNHERALAFWQGALGRPLVRSRRYPEYHGAVLPGERFEVLVQRLQDGPSRAHVDIHTDDLEAEVTRLEGLGARRVRLVNGWWIMEDPGGLPFCGIPDLSGELTDDTAQRWD